MPMCGRVRGADLGSAEDPYTVGDEEQSEQREQAGSAPFDDVLRELLAQHGTDHDGQGVGGDHAHGAADPGPEPAPAGWPA